MSQDSVPRMISCRVLSIRFASSAVFLTTEQHLTVIKRRGRLVCIVCLLGHNQEYLNNSKTTRENREAHQRTIIQTESKTPHKEGKNERRKERTNERNKHKQGKHQKETTQSQTANRIIMLSGRKHKQLVTNLTELL